MKRMQKVFFVLFLVVILFYNSYSKSIPSQEGYSGGSKDINKRFNDMNGKLDSLKIIVSMLQTEIGLIKQTLNSKLLSSKILV